MKAKVMGFPIEIVNGPYEEWDYRIKGFDVVIDYRFVDRKFDDGLQDLSVHYISLRDHRLTIEEET